MSKGRWVAVGGQIVVRQLRNGRVVCIRLRVVAHASCVWLSTQAACGLPTQAAARTLLIESEIVHETENNLPYVHGYLSVTQS